MFNDHNNFDKSSHDFEEHVSSMSQFNLGVLSEDEYSVFDDEQSVLLYRNAAERGHAPAQFKLGSMYDDGNVVTQDYEEAASWYRKAAEQGYADAQKALGLMYSFGEGVLQDHQHAVFWLHKAAEQGHALAQKSLGIMYYRGDCVRQDDVTAYAWFIVAASNGYQEGLDIVEKDEKLRAIKNQAQARAKEIVAGFP